MIRKVFTCRECGIQSIERIIIDTFDEPQAGSSCRKFVGSCFDEMVMRERSSRCERVELFESVEEIEAPT